MKLITIVLAALLCLCLVQAEEDCPTVCPENLKPTCGYNGKCFKFFDNECLLELNNCSGKEKFRKVHQTQCSHSDGPKC